MEQQAKRVTRPECRWIDRWYRCPWCLSCEGKRHAADCAALVPR